MDLFFFLIEGVAPLQSKFRLTNRGFRAVTRLPAILIAFHLEDSATQLRSYSSSFEGVAYTVCAQYGGVLRPRKCDTVKANGF